MPDATWGDVLDAAVAAWSARRLANGEARPCRSGRRRKPVQGRDLLLAANAPVRDHVAGREEEECASSI
jgi:hypothetical protein